jgi:hypothetical protein
MGFFRGNDTVARVGHCFEGTCPAPIAPSPRCPTSDTWCSTPQFNLPAIYAVRRGSDGTWVCCPRWAAHVARRPSIAHRAGNRSRFIPPIQHAAPW